MRLAEESALAGRCYGSADDNRLDQRRIVVLDVADARSEG
jgi:hypothetical protein